MNTWVPRLSPYDTTITPFGDNQPPDKPVHIDPGTPPPKPPDDPCAGKKGNLDFSDPAGKKWGMKDHIFPRHIEQTPKWKAKGKSVYGFPAAVHAVQALGFTAKQAYVQFLDQMTFERGEVTKVFKGPGGSVESIAYSYTLPGINTPAGAISLFVGTDNTGSNGPKGSFTNVNTVFVDKDCKTVITSFPGLPRGASPTPWMIWESGSFPEYIRFGW